MLIDAGLIFFFMLIGSVIIGMLINDPTSIAYKVMKAIVSISTIMLLGTCGAMFVIGAIMAIDKLLK